MPDTHHTFLVPDFIATKIKALNPPKSLMEIAVEAGFSRLETFEYVLTGDITLPMDRVRQLAAVIDCPVDELTRLAIKDWRLERFVGPVLDAYGQDDVTAAEHELIRLLRAHRGSQDLVLDDAVRVWITDFPRAASA